MYLLEIYSKIFIQGKSFYLFMKCRNNIYSIINYKQFFVIPRINRKSTRISCSVVNFIQTYTVVRAD